MLQGERVADLMLEHARLNECKDIAAFKQEIVDIVMHTRAQTIKLGQVTNIHVTFKHILGDITGLSIMCHKIKGTILK